MDQHHASRSCLSTLDQQPSTPISGTPEVLVIKPDLQTFSPCKDAALQEPNSESELFWCPWLYSELIIPDHPSQASADTVRSAPISSVPRTAPRRQHATSHQTSTLPGLCSSFSQSGPHLQCSVEHRGPQLQTCPPISASQLKHTGMEGMQPPPQRPITYRDVGIWLPHRLHGLTSTGLIFWEPPSRHPAPVRCRSPHKQGARARSHHRPNPVPPVPVAPVQPYDDQAQEGLICIIVLSWISPCPRALVSPPVFPRIPSMALPSSSVCPIQPL